MATAAAMGRATGVAAMKRRPSSTSANVVPMHRVFASDAECKAHYEAFYRAHYATLVDRFWSVHLGRASERYAEAEDTVQEAFTRCWRVWRSRCPRDENAQFVYIYRTAQRVWASQGRRKQFDTLSLDYSWSQGDELQTHLLDVALMEHGHRAQPEQIALARDELRTVLGRIPGEQTKVWQRRRAILLLYAHDECGTAELAKRLYAAGLIGAPTPAAAKTALFRARAAVRAYLGLGKEAVNGDSK